MAALQNLKLKIMSFRFKNNILFKDEEDLVYQLLNTNDLNGFSDLLFSREWDNPKKFFFALPVFNHSREQINKELIENQMIKDVEQGLFKCKKCGSTDTTYQEKQTRAADEPASIFISCNSCGHNWREG